MKKLYLIFLLVYLSIFTFGQTDATFSDQKTQLKSGNSRLLPKTVNKSSVVDVGNQIIYNFSGKIDTFTVPSNVNKIIITVIGAAGGIDTISNFPGGFGALVSGEFDVIPGDKLKLLVGETPVRNGGGGGSFVSDLLNNPIIIAGGGGGSGILDSPEKHGSVTETGGKGGGTGGDGGIDGNGGLANGTSYQSGAGGGFYTNGKNGSSPMIGGIAFVNGGTKLSVGYGDGGFGGGGTGSGYIVGGGGGGFSGGGAAGNGTGGGVGGGGASFNSGNNQNFIAQYNSGHGQIIIELLENNTCPGNITVDNNPGECSAIVDFTVTAPEKGNVVQTGGLPSGSEFPIGTTTNTFLLTDSLGVEITCSFTVTVNDTEPPVIDCPEDIVVSNDPGECCAVVNFPNLSAIIAGEAQPGITLPNAQVNQAGIAYNTEKNLYYAVRAGSSSYTLYTYDENGSQLAGNTAGFDFRGLWWNTNTSALEGNSYNSNGYRRVDLDANGYALSTGTNNPASNYQPDSQSQADYDYDLDEVIYYHNNSIYRTSRTTGALIGSPIGITGLPANTLNSTFVGYTGIPGEEVLIYDYSNKAVYFVDKTTGVYAHSVQLPSSAPGQSYLNTSYANSHIWISDGTLWHSYKIAGSGLADNCGTATATYDYPSGTCFPVGTTEVTITATDDAGNITTCTFNVTVKDTTSPVVVAPADIEIEADENCEWDTSPEKTGLAVASDNCSGEPGVALSYSDIEEDMGGGVVIITRTWTATDASGNTASDQQVITVTGGNAPPVLELNEISIYLTESGQWTLNQFDIAALTAGSSAGCGVEDDLNFVVNPRYFHCADVFAPVEITVTASDSRGNSASGKVFVNVYDTIAPIAYCKDTTIYLDSFGQTLIVPGAVNQGNKRESVPEWARYHNNLEGGSIDACGIQYMDLSKQIFTCNDIGENVVTLTVYDPSGNFATCQAIVTVIDPIAPVFVPVSDIEYVVAPGICETNIPYPQITATDNCPVTPELVEGFGPGGLFPIGTTTETWKAVDASGNEAWLTFNVTVKTYNAPPTIAAIEDIVVDEDPILIEIPLTNITPNVDCNDQQIISLQVTTDNPELISALNLEYVMGETTGTLLVTVGPNMNGEAWVTITVKDNGGTANGGSDTTVETFKITVVPVPDMPEVTAPVGPIAINPGEKVSIDLNDVFSNPDDEDDLTYEVTLSDGTSLPHWMEFDPETGIISGTPGDEDAGVYEVTVVATNSNGDSVETTFTVVIVKAGTSVISGTVQAAEGPVSGGISVMLFSVDINNMQHIVGNVAVAANGTFAFYNIENGTYLVKAVVTDAAMHPTLFHTWYKTALSVLEATTLSITSPGTQNIQITMVDGRVTEGEYSIAGHVMSKTDEQQEGTPAPNVELLLKQNGIIVAVTMTDQSGNYIFEGLKEGIYKVFVEVQGYQQKITVQETLNASNPNPKNVNFTIWLNDESIITDMEVVDNVFEIKMYPNPSKGMINIDMTWNDIQKVEVTVLNMLGAKVFTKEYLAGSLINFNLSDQVTGMYMVRIVAKSQSVVKKLVLDR
jgi:hypothetical protein